MKSTLTDKYTILTLAVLFKIVLGAFVILLVAVVAAAVHKFVSSPLELFVITIASISCYFIGGAVVGIINRYLEE